MCSVHEVGTFRASSKTVWLLVEVNCMKEEWMQVSLFIYIYINKYFILWPCYLHIKTKICICDIPNYKVDITVVCKHLSLRKMVNFNACVLVRLKNSHSSTCSVITL